MSSNSRASCGVVVSDDAVSAAEPRLPVDFCLPVDDNVCGPSLEGDGWSASTSVLLDDRPLCGTFEGLITGEWQEQTTCLVNACNRVSL
jgi:hypothetical protein